MMNTSTPSLCTATLQVLLVTDCYPKTCFWYLHVLWVKTRQSISFEPSIIFRHARWEKNHYVVTCSFPICVIVFLAVSSVMLKLRYPAPKKIYLAMDQYLYIPFLGDEHPFTSYFDVHQGDRVLTHCHLLVRLVFHESGEHTAHEATTPRSKSW